MYSLRKSNISEISKLISSIPEFEDPLSTPQIEARLRDKKYQIVIAEDEGQALGFMISYSLESSKFNLWLIGVIPEHRKKGVGTFLMNEFTQQAVKTFHDKLVVKTLNRHKSMIKLLVDLGYDIVKFETPKITFEKRVTEQGDAADLYGSSNLNWM